MRIVNVYFTNGFLKWGKLFIESYTYYNGIDDKMVVFTRNLNKKQINGLYKLRDNIEIENKNLNLELLSEKAGIDKNKLVSYKRETEREKVSGENKVWKLMIAGDDRIKQIYELMNELNEGDHILHFDADTYIQRNVSNFWDELQRNDFSTIFRINKQIRRRGKVFRENRATLICVMGFTVNENSKRFMKSWIDYIDKVPPSKRSKGYGQTSCYYAWRDMNNEIKDFRWGQFRDKKRSTWMNANKGYKDQLLVKARKDFDEIRKEL